MMGGGVVGFAYGGGEVLEPLGDRLPPIPIVGARTQSESTVDTPAFEPAVYTEYEIALFKRLRRAARRAVAVGDTRLLGQVASASARINQRFLPKPELEPLLRLCIRHGGCGIQVAHSGTILGLIFDARRPDAETPARACSEAVRALGMVAAVGDGVPSWGLGDEVCALLPGGGYAEKVTVTQGHVLPIPLGTSPLHAAALPETACTVWENVFEVGRLKPDETLLVHGGASGIGTLAIQLASALGSTGIWTSGALIQPSRRRPRSSHPPVPSHIRGGG